jgi:hypothetical protein
VSAEFDAGIELSAFPPFCHSSFVILTFFPVIHLSLSKDQPLPHSARPQRRAES